MTKNLPEILYPLFWVDENFELDKKNADLFKSQVKTPLAVIQLGKYVLTGVGAALVAISFTFTMRRVYRKRRALNEDHQTNNLVDESSPLIINNDI